MKGVLIGLFLVVLLLLGIATAAVFAAPSLVLIGLFAGIYPGIILFRTPTVFFYLLIFTVPWLVLEVMSLAIRSRALRWMNRILALTIGAAVALRIAFAIPNELNQETQQALDAAVKTDIVPAAPIASAPTIALLWEGDDTPSAESCTDLCLLLLYNGVAERVISLSPEGRRRTRPTLFRIERRAACNPGRINDRPWTDSRPAKDIIDAVRLRIAAGECLISEPPGDVAPDLTIIHRADVVGRPDQERLLLRSSHIDSISLEVAAGDAVLARIGERQTRMFRTPLSLYLPIRSGGGGSIDLGQWEWTRRNSGAPKLDVLATLSRVTSFNLSLPGSQDVGQLRQQIDDLLDDVTIPRGDARFALLRDYYRALSGTSLGGAGLDPSDAERLVRLIVDDRVQAFSEFPSVALKVDDAAARFRAPLLARLQRQPADDRNTTSALQQIAARLPAGAYRDDTAALDALLATPEGLLRFPRLIARLADRGSEVVPRLLAIIRQSRDVVNSPANVAVPGITRSLSEDDNWRSGGIGAAALQGLCMLGPDAAAALPDLRRIAQEGVISPNMQRGNRWRMSLIKLGAKPSEFEKPARESGPQSRYEERLAKEAQRSTCRSF